MAVDVLLGMQWGDEGKGKVVDYIAPQYDVVARFQGGPNAGHTLEFDGIKHVLHQIPSGIFHETITNIIGNGIVLDPVVFQSEIEKLAKFNINFDKNLFISKNASLILPSHKILESASEKAKGANKIGTTLKGIGPAYTDKISRQGLRVGDILYEGFEQKYQQLVDTHRELLDFYNYDYNFSKEEQAFFEAVKFLKQFNLVKTEYLINDLIDKGNAVLAEGAQGSLLDIDFGSYPFVTTSNTMAAGACSGLGIAPGKIRDVYGIFKAYCTRVGSGPFPTELNNETANKLSISGNEFGSTTGRKRRCGWLDLPALKYAAMLNGVTKLLMMKVDVLNDFDEIKVCDSYQMPDGSITENIPFDMHQEEIRPVYKTFKGWKQNIEKANDFSSLPPELNTYLQHIETSLQTPISLVSIGPDRKETLVKNELMREASA